MQINGIVGPQVGISSFSNGSSPALRLGNMGETITSDLHGRYYEGTYRGGRFGGANQAAVAVTAAFTLIYTGLVLYNPMGSPVNACLEKVGLTHSVAWPAASSIGLMIGQSTTALTPTTPLAPKSKKVGSGVAPVCSLLSAATLPVTPTLDTLLASVGSLATTGFETTTGVFDIGGEIILTPGSFVGIYSTVGLTAAGLFSMTWEEVPV